MGLSDLDPACAVGGVEPCATVFPSVIEGFSDNEYRLFRMLSILAYGCGDAGGQREWPMAAYASCIFETSGKRRRLLPAPESGSNENAIENERKRLMLIC
jgi:hypothetical protein